MEIRKENCQISKTDTPDLYLFHRNDQTSFVFVDLNQRSYVMTTDVETLIKLRNFINDVIREAKS